MAEGLKVGFDSALSPTLRGTCPAEPVVDRLPGYPGSAGDLGYWDTLLDTQYPKSDAEELPVGLLNSLGYTDAVAA